MIYIEAARRSFRNGDPPLNLENLARLKLQRLIGALSNVPSHI